MFWKTHGTKIPATTTEPDLADVFPTIWAIPSMGHQNDSWVELPGAKKIDGAHWTNWLLLPLVGTKLCCKHECMTLRIHCHVMGLNVWDWNRSYGMSKAFLHIDQGWKDDILERLSSVSAGWPDVGKPSLVDKGRGWGIPSSLRLNFWAARSF